MTRNSITHYISILIIFTLYGCANQGPSPDGGPQDTIPPTVINSAPINQSLNYHGRNLYFEFDERITAEKLKQQLIITPNTDLDYSILTKKNTLLIRLQSDLEDSTTYSFNFLDGVADITEKNPVINFKLAFSTGPFIDSMKVSGQVIDLITSEPKNETIVGLYDIKDTVDVHEKKPKYFISTAEDGSFSIENIKSGDYKIFTWVDKNKNLMLETEEEAFGFKNDTLSLFKEIDSIKLVTYSIDTRVPKVISARNLGRYFNVKYNKQISNYNLIPAISTQDTIASNFLQTEKVLRIYNDLNIKEGDSLTYYIEAIDSLQQQTIDTVHIKFNKTKRKPEQFTSSIEDKPTTVKDTIKLEINFNKPVPKYSQDSILIAIDTVSFLPTKNASSTWNKNKTVLKLKIPISWKEINDSIQSLNKQYIYLDSIETDSTKKGPLKNIQSNQLFLLLKKGAFSSVENDSLDTESIRLKKEDPEQYGKIILSINSQYKQFWLEVIDIEKNNKVIRRVKITDQKQVSINKLEPGKYNFRCKIDSNNDGKWSFGNFPKNQEPELVIQQNLETSLKANFEINLNLEL